MWREMAAEFDYLVWSWLKRIVWSSFYILIYAEEVFWVNLFYSQNLYNQAWELKAWLEAVNAWIAVVASESSWSSTAFLLVAAGKRFCFLFFGYSNLLIRSSEELDLTNWKSWGLTMWTATILLYLVPYEWLELSLGISCKTSVVWPRSLVQGIIISFFSWMEISFNCH